jgi:hypothetical protein
MGCSTFTQAPPYGKENPTLYRSQSKFVCPEQCIEISEELHFDEFNIHQN